MNFNLKVTVWPGSLQIYACICGTMYSMSGDKPRENYSRHLLDFEFIGFVLQFHNSYVFLYIINTQPSCHKVISQHVVFTAC